MSSFLFERPVALFLAWVAVQFILTCLWSWRRSAPTGRAAVAGLIAGPLLVAASHFVVTSAEEVMATCERVAGSIDDGDMNAIAAAFAPDFEAAGLDRDAFLSRLEQTLTRVRVEHPRLSGFDVQTEGNSAVATLNAICGIRSEEVTFDPLPSRWRATFRHSGEAWLITSIESIPVPPLNIRRLEEWLR